ncbi:conserved hypothetical protein [Histoplasma capsulatum G186AR]|uniref:Uncharacterized protein n=1 Tax=Ajellomyces capsulatus (strain G186AR / H82 / ATCC MYA-2454 / RMSCC 2432) TaxID=447093 RepID=C0NKD8_AJECG|nr:uncharacterized protein HCBG_03618 [Histoplasma capsulatum G186AR]EEH08329.1 conserved hypothetical protein [Histoplasma capsulatum G186AR]
MRSALYFFTALLAAGSAVASAVPPTGDVGGEDLKVVNLTEDDLEPIPDGGMLKILCMVGKLELDRRGIFDCTPVVWRVLVLIWCPLTGNHSYLPHRLAAVNVWPTLKGDVPPGAEIVTVLPFPRLSVSMRKASSATSIKFLGKGG